MSPIEIHMNAHNSYYRCPLEWYSSVNLIININESKIVAKLGFLKQKNQIKDEMLFKHFFGKTETRVLFT